jgi:hypothetical protein
MLKLNLLTPSVLAIKVDEIEQKREKMAKNIMINSILKLFWQLLTIKKL